METVGRKFRSLPGFAEIVSWLTLQFHLMAAAAAGLTNYIMSGSFCALSYPNPLNSHYVPFPAGSQPSLLFLLLLTGMHALVSVLYSRLGCFLLFVCLCACSVQGNL